MSGTEDTSNHTARQDSEDANESYRPAEEHLEEVIEALEEEHGTPTHGNFQDPMDELIYIKLSQQTNEPKFRPMYSALQRHFPGWKGLESATQEELESMLKPIGFHRQRAEDLRQLARYLLESRGNLDLSWLRDLGAAEAVRYLEGLPGVGLKTALCVAMYSLGHDVLPVDVHVERVSQRLGLIEAGLSPAKKHRLLAAIVPANKRYSYHVNCVAHGRQICRKVPRCERCHIRQYCRYYHEASSQGPEVSAEEVELGE